MDEKILSTGLFNSDTEFALRILSLLEIEEGPISMEGIFIIDFMACYPSAFGIEGEDVVGTNSFLLGELPLRRQKVSEALRVLLFKGLVDVNLNPIEGFLYVISEKGHDFDLGFNNDYMEMYRENIYSVLEEYEGKTDFELMEILEARLSKETD